MAAGAGEVAVRAAGGAAGTIAALATAPGVSETAVVRVSGPAAPALLERLFIPGPGRTGAGRFNFADGRVRVADGLPPVPCRVLVMRAPRSYTREDVVEFHLPGSPVLAAMLLETLRAAGIRPAGPGEFTRRAFENGRIGLVEAAAVMDLIAAEDRAALDAARSLLLGGVAGRLEQVRERARDLAARVELGIDFSGEAITVFPSAAAFAAEVAALEELIAGLRRYGPPPAARAGAAHVVVAGLVNAGKSTLVNRLLGYDRSRVASTPGTTRDLLSGTVTIAGRPFVLYDSPGFSTDPDRFEQAARRIIQGTGYDGMFMLLLTAPDEPIPPALQALFLRTPGPARTIVAGTKADLGRPNPGLEDPAFAACFARLAVAAGDPASLDLLRDRLAALATDHHGGGAFAAAGLLDRTLAACAGILARLRAEGDPFDRPELAAEELREVEYLTGTMAGDDAPEELLDRIFSTFCIGK